MGNVSVEEGEVSHNWPQHRLEIMCCVETVNYMLCNTFFKLKWSKLLCFYLNRLNFFYLPSQGCMIWPHQISPSPLSGKNRPWWWFKTNVFSHFIYLFWHWHKYINVIGLKPCQTWFNRSVFLRTYCETDIDPAHRKYSQLQAAVRYLLGKEPDLECRFLTLKL